MTKYVPIGLNSYENPKNVKLIECSASEGSTMYEWFLIGVKSQTTAGSVLKSD